MNQMQAEGMLVAFAVNQLLGHEPDPDFPGCCTVHCGPCAGLKWLRDNNPKWANRAVTAIWDGDPDGLYEWQCDDATVDWDKLEARWSLHKGCSSSNGICESCVADSGASERR